MTGFFSKKQYTIIVNNELAMKLLNKWYLECSIYTIFFNPSLSVSIKALFPSCIKSLFRKKQVNYSLYLISFMKCFISFLRMRNQKISLARIIIVGYQQINPIIINPRTDSCVPSDSTRKTPPFVLFKTAS